MALRDLKDRVDSITKLPTYPTQVYPGMDQLTFVAALIAQGYCASLGTSDIHEEDIPEHAVTQAMSLFDSIARRRT